MWYRMWVGLLFLAVALVPAVALGHQHDEALARSCDLCLTAPGVFAEPELSASPEVPAPAGWEQRDTQSEWLPDRARPVSSSRGPPR
ncbi:MAG: hypothetical protein IPM24_10680 [Bryobacterales bacterium]|nr:hypothetical protein [Bryobacterales bacterium]